MGELCRVIQQESTRPRQCNVLVLLNHAPRLGGLPCWSAACGRWGTDRRGWPGRGLSICRYGAATQVAAAARSTPASLTSAAQARGRQQASAAACRWRQLGWQSSQLGTKVRG